MWLMQLIWEQFILSIETQIISGVVSRQTGRKYACYFRLFAEEKTYSKILKTAIVVHSQHISIEIRGTRDDEIETVNG